MMENSTLITEDALSELARAGGVHSLQARQSGNGRYALVAQIGLTERTLRSRRNDVRMWANLDTLARYVRDKIGVNRFEVVG